MVTEKKIGNKLLIFALVLLLFTNVFAQENRSYKFSDKELLEKVEKYLNNISFFNRLFLNIVIKKIDPSSNRYIHLDKDASVKLIINDGLDFYIDYTDPNNSIIYITSGCFLILENESEIVAGIAHELGHLSSVRERMWTPFIYEERLEVEMAADVMGILIAKEMGYKFDAAANVFRRILEKYPANIAYQKFLTYRILAMVKLEREIYKVEPGKEYKEYLYFTKKEFKELKEIVKHLQDKKSGY